eukprot:TRINITY_DN64068_c0_g1_i1.p1 TRINITY_DN64068_c0_g1~~TRINITY_DN64068_c0_g1_i1.p1  ORF type:complete len:207 (-),score=28.81 TRINITY_DN64068_c0_g1_i1:258-878(-)
MMYSLSSGLSGFLDTCCCTDEKMKKDAPNFVTHETVFQRPEDPSDMLPMGLESSPHVQQSGLTSLSLAGAATPPPPGAPDNGQSLSAGSQARSPSPFGGQVIVTKESSGGLPHMSQHPALNKFDVQLESGTGIGLVFVHSCEDELIVRGVVAGEVLQWNQVCQEHQKVRVGDRIVLVNGLPGNSSQLMLRIEHSNGPVTLTIQKAS